MIIQIAGYLSGVAILLSFIPYIRGILKRKTKPERMSWFIWGLLGSIFFFSQLAKGATYSNILAVIQTLGDFTVFFLAIKYGVGGLLKRDVIGLVGVGVGLFLWYLTKEAAFALFIAIFVDAIGAVLTIIKTYEFPETENVLAWIFTFFGGFFALIAVGKLDFMLLAFPLYICLASLSILMAVAFGYKAKFQNEIK